MLPQFIDPAAGSTLKQALALGGEQIVISVVMNSVFVMSAGSIALFLATRPGWAAVQRRMMGTVLAGLAIRMMTEARR